MSTAKRRASQKVNRTCCSGAVFCISNHMLLRDARSWEYSKSPIQTASGFQMLLSACDTRRLSFRYRAGLVPNVFRISHLSLKDELVLKDSLKLLDVLKLSLKDELVLKDSLNELDVLKLSLSEELVLKGR